MLIITIERGNETGEKNEEKNNNIITGRESDDSWNSCSPVPEPEQQKSDPSF